MEKVDIFNTITKSVEKFRCTDHLMAEDSLRDSYYRGDMPDTEDRLQRKFFRKCNNINLSDMVLDFDFNYEFNY